MIKIKNKMFKALDFRISYSGSWTYKSLIYIFFTAVVFAPAFAFSAVMSSENYQIGTNAVFPGAFQTQNSDNYIIQYPWQNTTAVSSKETAAKETTSGGGVVGIGGMDSGLAPVHVNAFNVPLVVTGGQSGTLTYNFPNDLSVVVNVPRGITPHGVTIIARAEKRSIANEYLIPPASDLIGDVFWNITATNSGGDPVGQFNEYITITLKIPDSLTGVKDLGVYWLNVNNNKWILVPDVTFTETEAVFRVNHLTKFAIFGKNKTGDNLSVSAPRTMANTLGLMSAVSAKKEGIGGGDIVKPEGPGKIETVKRKQDERRAKERETVLPRKMIDFGRIVWFLLPAVLLLVIATVFMVIRTRKHNS